MFSVGDTVLYGTQGVCRIKEKIIKRVGKKTGEYFVLAPVAEKGSAVYIPTDNETLLGKMRRVLTSEEVDSIVTEAAMSPKDWIEDDNIRAEHCSEVIKSGDRAELLRIICMLYLRREDLRAKKKHFHNADEQFLKVAEKLFCDEMAYILGIAKSDVPEYIRQKADAVIAAHSL